MERRKSFVGLAESERRVVLLDMVDPLMTLRALIEALCTSLGKFSSEGLETLQHEHKTRFCAKFEQLYAPQKEDGDR